MLIRNAAKLNLAPKEEKLLKSEQLKIIESLEKLIITDQYYQNENITLDRVAKKLNTNRTYLSEAVNESYSIGFSKWLNQIRIKESIKLLSTNFFISIPPVLSKNEMAPEHLSSTTKSNSDSFTR